MNRKGLIIGSVFAAAAVAAVLVGGVVRAQTPSPGGAGQGAPANGPGADVRAVFDNFLNGLAANLGVGRSTLDSAIKTTAKQQIDQAVAAGKMTQDQADRIKQRIDSGQGPFGFGLGAFGRGGRGGPGGGAFAACGSSVQQAVTGTLGISQSDLRQARINGKSISQIAQDHGKTQQDLRSAVTSAMKGCLDQQVQAGTITSDQEQNILQRIQSGPGFPGGRGSGGGDHRRGPGSSGGNQ